jgi:putative FmdB family regulatory protein
MPVYNYFCNCGTTVDIIRTMDTRDESTPCGACGREMQRRLAAPLFKFHGRVTPGGGPDKFTADMLGIPLHDLPPALKADK